MPMPRASGGVLGDIAAADEDRACLRLLDAGDDAQQHGLAAARGAEDADDLARVDRERQAVDAPCRS